MTTLRFALLGAFASVLVSAEQAAAATIDKVNVDQNIQSGLDWLAKQQIKRNDEGWWEGNGGTYPTAMTGMAGMCFLLEGSTMKEGRYGENIRKAVNWYLERSQANGLLGNPSNPTEASQYMYGHGFGMLFLACAYGEEDNDQKRKELEKVLSKAVLFCGKAQTDRGGWGYVSGLEGGNFDEGSVTITQLQGLRAARNAGIHVPKSIIDKAVKYLHDCTTPRGGIIYSLALSSSANAIASPALTAAAVACAFSAGDYKSEDAKKWLKYCRDNIPFGKGPFDHDEYQNYYFSQAVYVLGDDGYNKLFPGDKKPIKWSEFRNTMFEYLKNGQQKEGYWNNGNGPGSNLGAVYCTAINLTILQLENAALPIYQR